MDRRGMLRDLGGFSFLFFTGRGGSFLSQRRERKEWGRKICLLLSFRERKERDFTASLSFSYRAKLLCFNRNDFATVVVAASLARSVRQARLAALRASDDAGDRQFPVGAASLISSRAGYFSLGYCHAVHLLGLNASRHIVYILSRSCCKAANLGSGSGLQLQGPRLRLAPQRKHRPLQSGLQSS